jgi:hypothetical protein
MTLRYGANALIAIGTACLAGCATSPEPAPVPAGPVFSTTTPVHIIAADPRGRAILRRDVPGLMASRSYILFDDMSLTQIAALSGGRLTAAKLDQLETDFMKSSHPSP